MNEDKSCKTNIGKRKKERQKKERKTKEKKERMIYTMNE